MYFKKIILEIERFEIYLNKSKSTLREAYMDSNDELG